MKDLLLKRHPELPYTQQDTFNWEELFASVFLETASASKGPAPKGEG